MVAYESERFGDQTYAEYSEHEDFSFPEHMHRCLELTIVTEGELTVGLNGVPFSIKPDEGALFLSNQIHSYATNEHSKMVALVFSPDLVPVFIRKLEGKIPVSPCFALERNRIEELVSLFSEHKTWDVLSLKGILYLICGDFFKQSKLIEAKKTSETLIFQIIQYVQNHFTEDISLRTLSKALGYNYYYLSRYISTTLKGSFSRYLNNYRVSYAANLIMQNRYNITEIAFISGFPSIRTFNSVFRKKYGLPPSRFGKK